MARQIINLGTADKGNGDPIRVAFEKTNSNFAELYNILSGGTGGRVIVTDIIGSVFADDSTTIVDGVNARVTANSITGGAIRLSGSTIDTTDSSAIIVDQILNLNSDVNVGGNITPNIANGGDLGSSAKPWRSLYVSGNTVYLGGVPLSLEAGTNELKVNNVPISQTITYADIPNVPTDVSDLTDTQGLLGGGAANTGDITFANSTMSAGNEDEIIVQAKDINGFATARLSLEPVYSNAQLSAYSAETVETFTLANGDFATGVWQNNGFGNGVVSFTGAQNIGDFFQNTLMSLTAANVSITINSEPAIIWNGGTNGAGTSTPGFGTNPTVPASPITITSIVFRYRSQSFVSVNQDNSEIRLKAQNATIRMDADLDIRMFADSQIEIQSGDTLSISAGESISISNGSNDTISISTGDLNITAFDDVNFRGSDSFRIRNTSATAPIRIITDDNNTQRTWAFNPDGNLTLPGNLQSEGNISIEINLADSTRRIWRFGEDGDLRFPDGTVQSSAGISSSSTDTLTNKTINIQAGQGNVFQIQGNSITSYSGSGAVLALTSMPTFSGMNVNNSSLSIDGGSGSFYANTAFADGAGTIHKAGVYKSANNANNALFTFGANGAGTMSVVMDGSLFIGSALPANNGGLNTDYGGWLVVQAGAKFGGDLNTIGNFILDTPGNYVRFGDGTTQTTAADFGYLDLDKDTIKGTSDYQYTFATDGYFTASTSSESPNYFFVAYNTTNANIAAGWTVVGGTANTTVSSVTYPVAGYPGVIRVNLTAAASSTSGFYPVTVTSPDRLRVEIQPNPGTSDKFAFTTSGLTFPDATVQTTAYTGTANLATVARNIESEGDVSIRVNLTDSTTHTWRFGEDGDLTLPSGGGNIQSDGVIQLITGGSTVTVTDNVFGFTNNVNGTIAFSMISGSMNFSGTGNFGFVGLGQFSASVTNDINLSSGSRIILNSPRTEIQGNTVDIRSEDGVNIDINLSDSTLRRWRFGEDGDLAFPDGTVQTTAFTGNAATVDIMNTNGIDYNYSITFVENRSATQNLRADVDLTFNSATNTLTAANFSGNLRGVADIAKNIESEGDVSIRVNLTDSTTRIWRFGEDGILNLPDGGDIVDSTGTSVLGGGGGGSVLEEPFESKTTATGVVTHDATTNRLFYHTSISANFTANFTNLGLAANEATSVSLVLVQGSTARMVTAVQIGGAAQTITWQGSASAPSGNANRTDVVTFSILCTATDTYTVLGMLTSFGG